MATFGYREFAYAIPRRRYDARDGEHVRISGTLREVQTRHPASGVLEGVARRQDRRSLPSARCEDARNGGRLLALSNS